MQERPSLTAHTFGVRLLIINMMRNDVFQTVTQATRKKTSEFSQQESNL